MAYCSYCAAALEVGQPVCSRCGRPAPVAAPVAAAPPTTSAERPSSIRLAVILLLISCVVSVLSLAVSLFQISGSVGFAATFLMRSVVILILWIVFSIALWHRQNWARFGVLALVVYTVGNVVTTAVRFPASAMNISFVMILVMLAIRLGAVILMFKTESSAWLKK
jgi:hypothetical protein